MEERDRYSFIIFYSFTSPLTYRLTICHICSIPHSYVILVKRGRLGKISKTPLLPLRESCVSGMYVFYYIWHEIWKLTYFAKVDQNSTFTESRASAPVSIFSFKTSKNLFSFDTISVARRIGGALWTQICYRLFPAPVFKGLLWFVRTPSSSDMMATAILFHSVVSFARSGSCLCLSGIYSTFHGVKFSTDRNSHSETPGWWLCMVW
jgi:hypothetical protein